MRESEPSSVLLNDVCTTESIGKSSTKPGNLPPNDQSNPSLKRSRYDNDKLLLPRPRSARKDAPPSPGPTPPAGNRTRINRLAPSASIEARFRRRPHNRTKFVLEISTRNRPKPGSLEVSRQQHRTRCLPATICLRSRLDRWAVANLSGLAIRHIIRCPEAVTRTQQRRHLSSRNDPRPAISSVMGARNVPSESDDDSTAPNPTNTPPGGQYSSERSHPSAPGSNR